MSTEIWECHSLEGMLWSFWFSQSGCSRSYSTPTGLNRHSLIHRLLTVQPSAFTVVSHLTSVPWTQYEHCPVPRKSHTRAHFVVRINLLPYANPWSYLRFDVVWSWWHRELGSESPWGRMALRWECRERGQYTYTALLSWIWPSLINT